MSFLQRLKGKGLDTAQKKEGEEAAKQAEEELKGVMQLEVDLYETKSELAIFALVPGAEIDAIDISIEGDNDVVVIEGSRERPVGLAFHLGKDGSPPAGKYYAEEISWGKFYRKIILPEPIDFEHADAKLENGVLVLVLPVLRVSEPKKHKLKIKKGHA